MKSRVKVITFPVLCDYIVHVEVTTDMKATFKKYKTPREDWKEEYDNGNAFTSRAKSNPVTFIFVRPNVSTGTIAHECWHAVVNIFEYVGANIDNELMAYHLGYLTNEVFQLVRNK